MLPMFRRLALRPAPAAALVLLLGVGSVNFDAADAEEAAAAGAVDIRWSVRIPLRDGVGLNATVYRPKQQQAPAPCIFTLTPYIGDTYHERAMYFAGHGLPFLLVDVRGRGNSEGTFTPFAQEVNDGYDVVEWLAKQPYCNGKVSMWGGSYAGYDQWATAKNHPPHLATIVPAAAAFPGVDFPARSNISDQYLMQWLTFTAGHASQGNLFADSGFWTGLWSERYKSGQPFSNLEHALGGEQTTLREWLRHPTVDEYLDQMTPTAEQFKALDIPILTITGSYDDDQPGALEYYKDLMRVASAAQRDKQFLIIGPWDHPATRTPRTPIGGIDFGPASLVDLPKLHLEWYRWTMAGGPKPEFLKDAVAYYVMGAELWRYAASLEKVTAATKPLILNSSGNPTQMLNSGMLQASDSKRVLGPPDHFIYDPREVSTAELESRIDPGDLTDQRMLFAQEGRELVYHSEPFDSNTEVSGFFRLSAWIALDQPDTDLQAQIYEVTGNGRSILLTTDRMRARYRESLRVATLVTTRQPLLYEFKRFTFVSRQLAPGSRLRLVVSPINSIYTQKNYNSGKAVSDETMADARPVTVTLVHDHAHASTLYVPLGAPRP
jgi:putative CocE/NonD family hydrolase